MPFWAGKQQYPRSVCPIVSASWLLYSCLIQEVSGNGRCRLRQDGTIDWVRRYRNDVREHTRTHAHTHTHTHTQVGP